MHISEGVLSVPVIAAGWAGCSACLAYSIKKTDTDSIPKIAVIAAIIFVASLIRIPVGVTSIHLTLLPIAGILLGWQACVAIFTALLLQAFLFQFGGMLSLGVNTLMMSSIAILSYYIFKYLSVKIKPQIGAAAAAFISMVAGGLILCTVLYLSDTNFINTAKLIMLAQIILAGIEAAITLLIIAFMQRLMIKNI